MNNQYPLLKPEVEKVLAKYLPEKYMHERAAAADSAKLTKEKTQEFNLYVLNILRAAGLSYTIKGKTSDVLGHSYE